MYDELDREIVCSDHVLLLRPRPFIFLVGGFMRHQIACCFFLQRLFSGIMENIIILPTSGLISVGLGRMLIISLQDKIRTCCGGGTMS